MFMKLVNDNMRPNDCINFIHRYLIAANHAFLWIAALSLAAFFHICDWFSSREALLLSTLVAYCAYLCESGLVTLRVAAAQPDNFIDFRAGSLWSIIALNVAVNISLSIIFLLYGGCFWFVAIIITAGWQKYMDGRIPVRLQSTSIPVIGNVFRAKML